MLKAFDFAAVRISVDTLTLRISIGGVSYGARGAKPPPQILQRRPENEG